MTNRTRTVHELAPWLQDALVQQADPLRHVCRHIAHELETGARDPADAAKLLSAALDAFPDAGTAAPPPSDLAELAGHMRSLQRALARTGLPGDVVMMTATAHANRCLEIGIERARADSAENLQ